MSTTAANRSLRAAEYYIEELGWAIVELPPGQKGPNRPRWQDDPIRTLADATATWGLRPEWGIGLVHAPSRTCALDVDDVAGARGPLALYHIDLDRLLAAAVRIDSGRPNRAKAIFALPPDLNVLPTRRVVNEGRIVLELRANGCQDVLPPSLHPDTGRPYEWRGRPVNVTELPEPLTALWLQLSETPSHTAPADPDAPIREGGRNAALFRLGCAMRRHGAPATVIEGALLETNAERCDPPLPEPEVRRTAASAARYQPTATTLPSAPVVSAWPGEPRLLAVGRGLL